MADIAISNRAVHLVPRVAINAVHATLAEVHIGLQSLVLTEIFIANPATMTGRTIAGHRRRSHELMPIDKATAHQVWLADVTFATGGVAIVTVVAEHFF